MLRACFSACSIGVSEHVQPVVYVHGDEHDLERRWRRLRHLAHIWRQRQRRGPGAGASARGQSRQPAPRPEWGHFAVRDSSLPCTAAMRRLPSCAFEEILVAIWRLCCRSFWYFTSRDVLCSRCSHRDHPFPVVIGRRSVVQAPRVFRADVCWHCPARCQHSRGGAGPRRRQLCHGRPSRVRDDTAGADVAHRLARPRQHGAQWVTVSCWVGGWVGVVRGDDSVD